MDLVINTMQMIFVVVNDISSDCSDDFNDNKSISNNDDNSKNDNKYDKIIIIHNENVNDKIIIIHNDITMTMLREVTSTASTARH